ncbi:GMC family oxidoreductase [Blastococcus sp. CT_GayMR20]|uniref:GMC family oxidoreductase n=1 Tax=Blastococcus sp. CT_GayMR20 TaxID=2559609 RepID=UPI00107365FE|nr:GMC family oxidoreductase [Blastococcus sp. CT_GayMR20]TFV92989.1 GMC family oxidoreductase [Blastococcus sp. CT_GayMR20]
MLLEAAVATGLKHVEDVNEPGAEERVGFVPNMIRKGLRESSDTAFLKPVRNRKNLTVATKTPVGYVLFDGKRARGVRLRDRGKLRDVQARREVILSAGGIASPLLLERSGVGNPEVLGRVGVPVLAESPQVGERILEQRMLGYQAKLSKDLGFNRRIGTFSRQMFEGAKYLLSRSGIVATGAYELVAFHKSSPEAPTADLISFINPLSFDLTAEKLGPAKHPGFQINGQLAHPTTASSVHITDVDADAPPVIDARYLETEYDRSAMPKLIDWARKAAAQSPLADVISEEEIPGPDVTTPEQLIASSWMNPHVYHATGSAGMGVADDDVVDASVFPLQPGNTAGPTVAMAWRAADKILEG